MVLTCHGIDGTDTSLACRAERPREETLIFSPSLTFLSATQRELVALLAELSRESSMRVALVGGVVRDLLRGESVGDNDLDCVVEGDAAEVAARCADKLGGTVRIFPDFLTAKVVGIKGREGISEIDFASARTELYRAPAALPIVTRARSLEEDLKRRDFTCNALALEVGALLGQGVPFTEELDANGGDRTSASEILPAIIDPHGGLQDLSDRVLRILHPDSFRDDPTRIFRGCRYLVRLDGQFEPGTLAAIQEAIDSGMIARLSGHRVYRELARVFEEPHPSHVLRHLEALRVPQYCELLRGVDLSHVVHALSVHGERLKDPHDRALFGFVMLVQGQPSNGLATFRAAGVKGKMLTTLEATLRGQGSAPLQEALKAAK